MSQLSDQSKDEILEELAQLQDNQLKDFDPEQLTLKSNAIRGKAKKIAGGESDDESEDEGSDEEEEDESFAEEDDDDSEDEDEDVDMEELDSEEEAKPKGKGKKREEAKATKGKRTAAEPKKEPARKRKKVEETIEEKEIITGSGKKVKVEKKKIVTTEVVEEKKKKEPKAKAVKGEKAASTKKEPKAPKAPKEPKAPKKSREEVDNELFANVGYFYEEFHAGEKEKAKTDLAGFLDGIISTKDFSMQKQTEFTELVKARKLHQPDSHSELLLEGIFDKFESKFSTPQDQALFSIAKSVFSTTLHSFYERIPCIKQTMFFPSRENETNLARVLRMVKKKIDVCIFTFTNDRFYNSLASAWDRGVKLRVISDDECSKFLGADIYRLALKGVPCTTDNHVKLHMHNKFCLIDDTFLVTGSFNWTSQAATGNQENLIVIEAPDLVKQYAQEFEKLWIQFKDNIISKELATQKIEEELKAKIALTQKAKEGKEKKKLERLAAQANTDKK